MLDVVDPLLPLAMIDVGLLLAEVPILLERLPSGDARKLEHKVCYTKRRSVSVT